MKKFRKESDLQEFLIKELMAVAGFAFHVHGGSIYQKRGIPDLYVAHRIWSGWVELKLNSHEVEPHQRLFLERLRERWSPCIVLRWLDGTVSLENEREEPLRQFEWSGPLPLLKEIKGACHA